MNDNKEYGIELQLKTDKFKQSLRNISQLTKKTSAKMKEDFKLGQVGDVEKTQRGIEYTTNQLKKYRQLLAEAQKQTQGMTKAGTTKAGLTVTSKQIQDVEQYKRRIVILEQTLRKLQENLDKLNTSKMTSLGQATAEYQQKLKEAWNRTKENKFTFDNFANSTKDGLQQVSDEANKTADNIGKVGKKAREMGDKTKEAGQKARESSTVLSDFGKKIENGYNRGIRSVKRFALSLFGIQSIWRVVSRASSAYLNFDTDLANKIQANWVALGSMLEPILTWITNMLRKLVGYINVFVKALTGKNFIKKASDKATASINNTAKATKKLTRSVTELDEVTNLQDERAESPDQNLGIANELEALSKIKLNEKIVRFIEIVAGKLKDLWEWLKKNKEIVKTVGELALIAFGSWKLAKLISSVKLLLGTAGVGGSGLLGVLAVLGAIYDVTKFIEYLKLSKEAVEVTKQKTDAEKKLGDIQVNSMKRFNEILEEKKGLSDEEKKNDKQWNLAIQSAKQTYEQYLINVKNGYYYTREQKREMEEYAKKIESVSGKEYITTVKTKVDMEETPKTKALLQKIKDVLSGGGAMAGAGLGSLLWKSAQGGRFATGTVAYKPTYGQFGEYPSASYNPEIVSPQSLMEQTLFSALTKALPLISNTGTTGGDVILNINGREFARATYSDFEYEGNRLGNNTKLRRA
jgi:methyl-accepting chemotaxis protein